MVQIFILGSSSVYGVGSMHGGWADLVKQAIHRKMYGENGVGEKYEVFNFGFSGSTIGYVKDIIPQLLKQYGRGGKTIIVINVGGNNSKAENRPDNYVSTIEDFEEEMVELLNLLKQKTEYNIAVGSGYVDEAKTNPKPNPLTGGVSYFSNARRKVFADYYKRLCDARGISFVDVEMGEEEWVRNYLYKDGLHPNQKGHEYISKKVLTVLEKLL